LKRGTVIRLAVRADAEPSIDDLVGRGALIGHDVGHRSERARDRTHHAAEEKSIHRSSAISHRTPP
jgi:hypothetical protein